MPSDSQAAQMLRRACQGLPACRIACSLMWRLASISQSNLPVLYWTRENLCVAGDPEKGRQAKQ
jgi:hypothetical protein